MQWINTALISLVLAICAYTALKIHLLQKPRQSEDNKEREDKIDGHEEFDVIPLTEDRDDEIFDRLSNRQERDLED